MPPMMPVIRARAGFTPTATAIPMQSGKATRKTTIDAKKSSLKCGNLADLRADSELSVFMI
jgi:hypothetical protein